MEEGLLCYMMCTREERKVVVLKGKHKRHGETGSEGRNTNERLFTFGVGTFLFRSYQREGPLALYL